MAARLADHVNDAVGLTRKVSLGHHDGKLQLNKPDDDAFGRFVEAAKSVHVQSPCIIAQPWGGQRNTEHEANPIFPTGKRSYFRRGRLPLQARPSSRGHAWQVRPYARRKDGTSRSMNKQMHVTNVAPRE